MARDFAEMQCPCTFQSIMHEALAKELAEAGIVDRPIRRATLATTTMHYDNGPISFIFYEEE